MKTKIIGHLEWQNDVPYRRFNWAQAKEYAASLGDGWRLPTRVELLTLVDDTRDNPACSEFPSCPADWYWTSTPCVFDDREAWSVDFEFGTVSMDELDVGNRVRCVREAQP